MTNSWRKEKYLGSDFSPSSPNFFYLRPSVLSAAVLGKAEVHRVWQRRVFLHSKFALGGLRWRRGARLLAAQSLHYCLFSLPSYAFSVFPNYLPSTSLCTALKSDMALASGKVWSEKGTMEADGPIMQVQPHPSAHGYDVDYEKHGASRESNPLPDLKRKLKSRHLQMIAIGESQTLGMTSWGLPFHAHRSLK